MWFMKLKIDKLVFLILLVTFLKGLVWAAVVPIWHTPDEQAHFAEIEFIAEKKRLPIQILNQKHVEKDLSKEILVSERLLGTERDEKGINKFTYHPEYNIPYASEFIGIHETEISNIPLSWRQEMVKNEATNYPPLYYLYGTIAYLFAYNSDLFTRIFMVRMFSVILLVLTVYFSLKISREIFENNFLMQMAVPILVSFQPMFTFVGAGVNSDNLINLLFTIFIYQGLRVVKYGFSFRLSILIGVIIGLGILTKPQFFIPIPIVLGIFLYELRKKQWKFFIKNLSLFSIFFILFGGWWAIRSFILTGNPTTIKMNSFVNSYSTLTLIDYSKMAFIKTIRETLPWYWGVFKWLGVTLPHLANQILLRIMALGFLGLIFWFIKIIKSKRIGVIEKSLIYLFLVNLIYIGSLYFFDFLFIKSHGFSIGMQGRYFLPAISSQMILLLWGLINLFPSNWLNLRKIVIFCLCLGIIILNFIALAIVFYAYYPAQNLSQALDWISQYKPWFLKGKWFVLLLTCYFIGLIIFLKNLLYMTSNSNSLKVFNN